MRFSQSEDLPFNMLAAFRNSMVAHKFLMFIVMMRHKAAHEAAGKSWKRNPNG